MAYRDDTLCGIFHSQALSLGDGVPFLMGKFDDEGEPFPDYRCLTWAAVRSEVIDLARGLIALKVGRADKVAIFSESRPRWVIADQAIQAVRGIEVPLYPTLSRDELAYMIGDSESRIIIVSTREKAEMALAIRSQCPELRQVITMGAWEGPRPEDLFTFNEVLNLGRGTVDEHQVEERLEQVRPEDPVSIIYTSGTTGRPKGAVLTQENWVKNMHQTSDSTLMRRQAERRDMHLMFLVHLPLCHVYGRTADYHVGGLKQAGVLAFESDFGRIPQALRELRPNVIISIPRFFEKVYDQTNAIISREKPLVKKAFFWSMRQGQKFADAMSRGARMGLLDMLQFTLANILVFNRVRTLSGLDRLVMGGSGGGKLSKEVCTFIRALGIQLTEGYGLTETSPVINYNSPEFRGLDRDHLTWFQDKMIDWTFDCMIAKQAQGKSPFTHPLRALKLCMAYYTVAYRLQIKPGTVGRPVVWTEEKIAPDGEILVRGPQVFKGYWKLPRETAEAFTEDGWFKTGDIGRFDGDGFLEITDRKKELFVTSGGKNVAPHPIELALTARPYIDQVCLIGDGRKYLTAFIVPDFPELRRLARSRGWDGSDHADLLQRAEVKDLIREQVDAVNAQLARYEQIKYYTVLERPFSIEDGELTPTLKLKRRIINERFKKEIEQMYAAQ